MVSKNNQILHINSRVDKVFEYTQGPVNIKITLRIDTKEELKAGLSIGKRFVEDVEKELEKLK